MGWYAFFDQNGDMAEKTRRRVYDMVAAEKLQLQGFHYPFPGLGNEGYPRAAKASDNRHAAVVVISGATCRCAR